VRISSINGMRRRKLFERRSTRIRKIEKHSPDWKERIGNAKTGSLCKKYFFCNCKTPRRVPNDLKCTRNWRDWLKPKGRAQRMRSSFGCRALEIDPNRDELYGELARLLSAQEKFQDLATTIERYAETLAKKRRPKRGACAAYPTFRDSGYKTFRFKRGGRNFGKNRREGQRPCGRDCRAGTHL